jgi:hypothetical protein
MSDKLSEAFSRDGLSEPGPPIRDIQWVTPSAEEIREDMLTVLDWMLAANSFRSLDEGFNFRKASQERKYFRAEQDRWIDDGGFNV